MNTLTDEELAARYLQRRDGGNLGPLVERFESRIYDVCFSILRTGSRAEDATQEVFLKLIETRELPEPPRFKAWLYRVAVNQALQLRREEARRARREEAASRFQTGEAPMADSISEADSIERLRREIDALEPELQQAVLLRYQHDLSFEEIAEVLDKPQGTVSRHVFEAREQLKRRLAVLALTLVSLDTLLRKVPIEPVSGNLHARLAALARRGAQRGFPVAKIKVALVAAALLIPAMVLVSRRPSAVAGATPTPSVRPSMGNSGAGSETAKSGDPARRTSPLLTDEAGGPGRIRNLEVRVRVTVTDASGQVLPSGVVAVTARRNVVLEAALDRREQPTTTEEAPGVFVITVPEGGRGLYKIRASAAKARGASAYVIAGAGDTVDVRLLLNAAEELQSPRPEQILLQEMETTRAFGAVRGRLAGYDPAPRVMLGGQPLDRHHQPRGVIDRESFLLIPVEAGRHEILIQDPCCTQRVPAEVRPGVVTDLGILGHQPKAGRDIAGVVLCSAGRPVPNASVLLSAEGDPPTDRSAGTDEAGRFLFRSVDPELKGLKLAVVTPDRIGVQAVSVEPGATEVRIRLPRSYVVLVAAFSEERAPLGASVWISERDGIPPEDTQVPSIGAALPDGRFRLVVNAELYPPGTRVKLGAHAAGYAIERTDWIVLQEGLELQLTLKKETSK